MRYKSFHITNEFDVFAVAACADSFAVPFFVLFSLAGYVAPPRSVPVSFHVEFHGFEQTDAGIEFKCFID